MSRRRGGRHRGLPSARSLRASGLLGLSLVSLGGLLMASGVDLDDIRRLRAQAPSAAAVPSASDLLFTPDPSTSTKSSGKGKKNKEKSKEAELLDRMPMVLKIPGDSAPIDATTVLADGSLQIPDTGRRIAWRTGGAAPGDKNGVVMLAGHVDHRSEGKGMFAALSTLNAGDIVSVQTYDGKRHRYVVNEKVRSSKQALPQTLFDRSGKHRLALVTCAGVFDREARAYPDNLVVWASPVRSTKA